MARVTYGKVEKARHKGDDDERDVYLDGEWAGTIITSYVDADAQKQWPYLNTGSPRYKVCSYTYEGPPWLLWHELVSGVEIIMRVDPDKNEARKKLAELKKKIEEALCE